MRKAIGEKRKDKREKKEKNKVGVYNHWSCSVLYSVDGGDCSDWWERTYFKKQEGTIRNKNADVRDFHYFTRYKK